MTTSTSDAQLVAGHLAGQPAALAGIYDRYADSLHDTAAAMLNDRAEAADVLQDVILVAAERLDQLRDPDRLKPWLFAILRNEVYRRTKQRRRTILTDFSGADEGGGVDMADHRVGDPGDAAIDDMSGDEMAELVRNAARGLDERDQLVLELSVRQGLTGQDLADALGVSTNQSYTLVHRMRDRVERSLGAFVVARAGRRDCDDLDQLLGSWDGEFTVLIRKRVARHIEKCTTCDRRRTKAVPFAMFAAAPVYAAPAALRDQILANAAVATGGASSAGTAGATMGSSAAGAVPYRFVANGGFPTLVRSARRVAAWVAPSAAAMLLIIAVGAAVTLAGSGDDDQLAGVASETTSAVEVTASADSIAAAPTDPSAPATSESATTSATTTTPSTSTTAASSTTAPDQSSSTAATPTTAPPTTAPPTSATPSTAPPTTTATVVAPPPAPPSTTTAIATTTTTTTTEVPLTPGQLVVSGGTIDLGSSASSGSVTLSNSGELPIDFVVTGDSGAFAISPSSGTISGGASTQLVASIDRARRPEGTVPRAVLTVSGGGASFSVVLAATVERPPVISSASARGFCSNGTVGVSAQTNISDESRVSATIRISGPNGLSASGSMNPDGPTWFGGASTSYPANEPEVAQGTWSWTITAVDARGNSRSASGNVTIDRC